MPTQMELHWRFGQETKAVCTAANWLGRGCCRCRSGCWNQSCCGWRCLCKEWTDDADFAKVMMRSCGWTISYSSCLMNGVPDSVERGFCCHTFWRCLNRTAWNIATSIGQYRSYSLGYTYECMISKGVLLRHSTTHHLRMLNNAASSICSCMMCIKYQVYNSDK